MDTEIDSRCGKWFNPPVITLNSPISKENLQVWEVVNALLRVADGSHGQHHGTHRVHDRQVQNRSELPQSWVWTKQCNVKKYYKSSATI